jgi:hypothetical protein
MKGLVAFDDLDAREGKRTIATQTVALALDGREAVLDLTDEHADELRDFLRRYMGAGVTGSKETSGVAGVWTERREYRKAFRERADRTGVRYLTPGGSYYYRTEDLAKFDEYLAGEIAAGRFPEVVTP